MNTTDNELIPRPPRDELHPIVVIAPRGFIYVGLAEVATLRRALRSGKHLEAIVLWDARKIIRYCGAAGSLGGLAKHGPLEKHGDEWQRYDEPRPGVLCVEVGDWQDMTPEAWEAVCAWPTYRG